MVIKEFISFHNEIENIIFAIVQDAASHGLWINTLSYLENCGARLIAACEHPTLVKEEVLKHASEEFRHAFYLKKQLARIGVFYEDYRPETLLGGWPAYHYLYKLNVQTARSLRTLQAPPEKIKELSYLLVTYAIELRAGELYPIYESALKQAHSKVCVRSILLEEKEHLAEMEKGLAQIPGGFVYAQTVCALESALFEKICMNLYPNNLKS